MTDYCTCLVKSIKPSGKPVKRLIYAPRSNVLPMPYVDRYITKNAPPPLPPSLLLLPSDNAVGSDSSPLRSFLLGLQKHARQLRNNKLVEKCTRDNEGLKTFFRLNVSEPLWLREA